jgi:hypothetical protein
MIWFVPESPLYHARKGQDDKAKNCMLKLYGSAPGYDVVSSSQFVREESGIDLWQEYEYRVIQHGLEAEKELSEASKQASFLEIFQGANWRRTLAGCTGICSQWTAGAPIVFAYSTVS